MTKRLLAFALSGAMMGMSACATVPHDAADHPEARLYDASADATSLVDAALERSEASDHKVLVVLGANWCHDSRAFAGWTETPRIGALLAEQYETVFVNVGMPQTGDGHNLHIARRFGLEGVEGTPTVLVLAPDGTPLNLATAPTWRNTATRSEDAIYAELAELAALDAPQPMIESESEQ